MKDINEIKKIIADAPESAGNYHKVFKKYYGGTSCLNLDNLRKIVKQAERISELESLCKECADYIDINRCSSIGYGSQLHKKLRERGGAE
jgi:hypothetical protein